MKNACRKEFPNGKNAFNVNNNYQISTDSMFYNKAQATLSAIGVGVFVGDRVGALADDQEEEKWPHCRRSGWRWSSPIGELGELGVLEGDAND